MLKALWILPILLLTACATDLAPQSTTHWQGTSVSQLTQQLGAPSELVNNPDGSSDYIYVTTYKRPSPPPTPVTATSVSKEGRPVIITSQPSFTTEVAMTKCITHFQVNKQHIITKVSAEGNGC